MENVSAAIFILDWGQTEKSWVRVVGLAAIAGGIDAQATRLEWSGRKKTEC